MKKNNILKWAIITFVIGMVAYGLYNLMLLIIHKNLGLFINNTEDSL